MAIQPIDLQIMYSQMQHVAKSVANAQFQPQLTQQMKESQIIQQQQEQAKSVHRAANEESKSTDVDEDGHSGVQYESSGNKKNDADQQEEPKRMELREGYLGRHIDITR